MKINRHNYEEFFLLYVDNELTVEQKKQVELFVKDNADLEEELVMLQQSKLIPDDTILFDSKEKLMKEENFSFINMSNYEEYLVLYADDELKGKEKLVVERFAAKHNHVKEELSLFLQTKLQPEKIVFADKGSLYRREGNPDSYRDRVISMSWWRVAVAAVLIIAAGLTTYSVLNKKGNTGNRADTAKTEQKLTSPEKTAVGTKQQQTNSGTNNKRQEQFVAVSPGNNKFVKEIKVGNPLEQKLKNLKDRDENKEEIIANVPVETKRAIQSINIQTASPDSKMNIDANTGLAINDRIQQQQHDFNKTGVTPEPPKTPDTIEYASNTENKKLRGFFRKATRFIERTTNINAANDDDRVLIGGMAINLK